MTKELAEMRQAIRALRLEVAPEIADDVAQKVDAFLTAWQAHLVRAHGRVACDYPWQVDIPESVA